MRRGHEEKVSTISRLATLPLRLSVSSSPRLFARFASPPRLFLAFVLGALILTYPLALHLFSHIPLGSEEAATVPLFNLWTLQWNIDQLLQGYPRYWDAPIFAPHKGTFAFSETQPLSALLALPLWLGFQSPALGYNALVLLFLTLNGWFAYWLLHQWGLPPLPALLAGLLVQALPFVAQEMGVLQLVAIFGFLWSFLYLSRFLSQLSSPRLSTLSSHPWSNGLCLALGIPVIFLTCGYYGLFSLLFLPLAFVFQLQRHHLNVKTGSQLLAIGLLALALTSPFVWTQRQQLAAYQFSRSAQIIEGNSAKPAYYRNFLDHNLLYGQILKLKSAPGQRLFPGFGLIILSGLGILGGQKRIKIYLILAAGLALILSLGLRLDLNGLVPIGLAQGKPYQWLRDFIPGFAQLRSPFRFAVLLHLHLALLAGFGLNNLRRWFQSAKNWLPVGLAALAIFEALALPLPLQPLPPFHAETRWQAWLNERAGDGFGAMSLQSSPSAQNKGTWPLKIVILPFAPRSKVIDFEQTVRWMLAGRYLRGEMLNGYSGFFPPDHGGVRDEMLNFPTEAGLQLLQQKGFDYVVVYHALAKAPTPEAIKKYLPLIYHDALDNVAIYALRK